MESPAPVTNSPKVALTGLVAAVVVLIAGVVLALTWDDDDDDADKTASGAVTTTSSTTTSSTTTSSSTTLATLPEPPSTTATTAAVDSTTTTTAGGLATTTTTTIEAAVSTPEAAAQGLWAAYRANDKALAQRFALPQIVDELFQRPYAPPDAAFQGCKLQSGVQHCVYKQPTTPVETVYTMGVQKKDDGNWIVTGINISGP